MLFCPHCQRKYQRKIYFERHTAVCEVLCKAKKERLLEVEERSDTPSVRDLYLVVMEMTVKYNQLEQKYQEMAKLVNIKKQKLDIGDWLNATYVDVKAYTSWFDDIMVSRDDLETLFQSDYVNGVVKVLCKCLPLEDELRPIRAYTTKCNVFYYYDQKNKWSVIDSDVYNKLMHLLDKKFMSEFLKWQNENRDRLHLDDFSLIYAKNVKKIMATREQLYSRIKKELYQYLKTDLPSVMEYVIT
jgi:hypothetical protein